MTEGGLSSKTPKERLLIALRKGRADHVGKLLDQFPDDLEPDMAADTAENRLAHRAARFGHASVVTLLASKCADLSATNKFGMTALHHGAVHGGQEVIEALLQAGADPNQGDDAGRLPLHWCASKGHVAGAQALLKGGARPKGTDKEGFTPLHRCGQEEPQGKEGEEEEDAYRQRLDTAKAEIAQILLAEGADTEATEFKGKQTPLHLAAMNGLVAVAAALLEAGAGVDSVNRIGQTPLIYAVVEQHVAMVRLLLARGADVNLGNSTLTGRLGWAPIHWAALSDNLEVLEAVLAAEGVSNVQDQSGRFPVQLAEEHVKEKVLARLQELPRD